MARAPKDTFDPKTFLAKVGAGKTILEFHKNQNVFEQGELASAVFYIQKGRVKMTVLSEQARKPSSQFWSPASSSAKVA